MVMMKHSKLEWGHGPICFGDDATVWCSTVKNAESYNVYIVKRKDNIVVDVRDDEGVLVVSIKASTMAEANARAEHAGQVISVALREYSRVRALRRRIAERVSRYFYADPDDS